MIWTLLALLAVGLVTSMIAVIFAIDMHHHHHV
jgi:hypothetical protein